MSSIFDHERDQDRAEYLEAVRGVIQPLVPTDAGTVLPYRLRRSIPAGAEARALIGFGVCGLAAAAGGSFFLLRGEITLVRGLLAAAAAILGLVSLWLIAAGIRESLALATPETEIEIDEIDLRPGRRVRLLVRQRGPVVLGRLALDLRCRETTWERVHYWVDENGLATPAEKGPQSSRSRRVTETNTNRVEHEVPIMELTDLDVAGTFEKVVDLEIPESALPTGKTRDRAIEWEIVVTGEVKGRADFRHPFPVVIRPA